MVFWNDKPPEEKKCDSSRRTLFQFRRYGPSKWRLTAAPPSGFGTSATYRTEDVSKSSSAATSAFTLRHTLLFRFSTTQSENSNPPPDVHVDNSEDTRTHKLPHPHRTCANTTTTYARVGCTSAEFREQVDASTGAPTEVSAVGRPLCLWYR